MIRGSEKFGLGFALEAEARPGMRSGGSYGWAGIYNTFYWVDPRKDIAAVFMTQISPFCDPIVIDLYARFESALYAAL